MDLYYYYLAGRACRHKKLASKQTHCLVESSFSLCVLLKRISGERRVTHLFQDIVWSQRGHHIFSGETYAKTS